MLFGRVLDALREHVKSRMRDETPPRYLIEKVYDLTDVPDDRLQLCLEELAVATREIAKLKRGQGANVRKARFIWIDDGKRNGTVNATITG